MRHGGALIGSEVELFISIVLARLFVMKEGIPIKYPINIHDKQLCAYDRCVAKNAATTGDKLACLERRQKNIVTGSDDVLKA